MKSKPMKDPNTLAANQVTNKTQAMRVSMGDPGKNDVKTDGIKIRGTGAATKGLLARGPMA
jgi:lipoate-protein ligase A